LSEQESRPGRRFYRPELDLLRFFCFLFVFLHHSLPRDGEHWLSYAADSGGFGVPVFFLLSAFLITELLLLERERTGRVHFGAFYTRRILRIWPLYFGFFFLCWLAGELHHLPAIPLHMTEAFVFLAGNWYFVLTGPFTNPAGILWSVSIEEQFYLLWPWIVRGAARTVMIVSLTVLPISYVTLAVLASHGASADRVIWANSVVQFQFFALGGILAVLMHHHRLQIRWWMRLLGLAVCGSSWMIANAVFRVKRHDVSITAEHACVGYALAAVGAAALFVAFYGAKIGDNWFMKWLVYLGKISYGLYVFHILMLGMAEKVLAGRGFGVGTYTLMRVWIGLAMTIVAAWMSYEWFEKPFLRLKEKFTFIRSRAA
jgi:peptidoglycan/LPS O-acetylase OafA/YrhL